MLSQSKRSSPSEPSLFSRRTRRGLTLQRGCVVGMFAALLATAYLRVPASALIERFENLYRDAPPVFEPAEPGTDDSRNITIRMKGNTTVVRARRGAAAALNEINDRAGRLVDQVRRLEKAMTACYAVSALLYLPLIVSVYWTTNVDHRPVRLIALSLVPVMFVLGVCFTFPISARILPFRPAFIAAYLLLIECVVLLVGRTVQLRLLGPPIAGLTLASAIVAGAPYGQAAISESLAAQYTFCALVTGAVICSIVPYSRCIDGARTHLRSAAPNTH